MANSELEFERLPETEKVQLINNSYAEKYGFSSDCQIVLSTGDNPSSLVGMGATTPGTMVISLGTSDTFAATISNVVAAFTSRDVNRRCRARSTSASASLSITLSAV